MIQITCVRNPFDPLNSREMRKVRHGRQIRELVREFDVHPGYDVAVSVDGRVLRSPEKMEYIPSAGASVVFCAVPMGDGKNPLAIVAMLAIMIAAPALAPGLMAAIAPMGFEATAFGVSMATMGITVAGGLAVQAIFPMSQPDIQSPGALNSSPTYAWEKGSNMILEGYPLPELFGTCRVTPPKIGQYVYADGDKQFINMLFAIAGHQLYSMLGIRINEVPIENMIGVGYEPTRDYRDGSVNQPVLQHFDDTRTDIPVGVKLTDPNTYTERTTSGNVVNGFSLTFAFPKGLFRMDDSGAMQSHTVKIYAEYKKNSDTSWTRLYSYNSVTFSVSTPRWSAGYWNNAGEDGTGGTWIEIAEGGTTHDDPTYADAPDYNDGKQYFPSGWNGGIGFFPADPVYYWRWLADAETIFQKGSVMLDYIGVTRNQVSPVYHTEPVFFPGASQPDGDKFDLRCRLVEALPTSARYGTEVWWESFQEVVIDDFTYPGVALLALRALATDQLSGAMPRVDMLATRNYVPVWTGAMYEQKQAWIPAWACYHILHRAEYKGTGDLSAASSYEVRGIPADRIDYAAFSSWAGWCWTNNYYCNLYVDQSMSVRKALDILGTLGRGCVVQLGSKFTCIVDRIEVAPVQRFLFTVGNIVADSFQEEWLPVTDRANAIEVTFFDASLDYERQTVTVYAQDFDTAGHEINTMQATLYGCVNRDMAIKYGKFLINSNKYLTLTCSFDADVDAIACIPGDVIEVAHDVPQWGYSGRVVSATTDTITFDRPVTIEFGTSYAVMVKHQDDDSREEKTVTTGAGTYTTVSISGTWTKIPALHALYSFGEVDHVVKEFRVLRITRSQEMRRKLTCLEYVAEVYVDGATIPEPEVISDLPDVTGLTASEVYRGGSSTFVYLKWRGFAIKWRVFISRPFFNPSFGWLNGPPELLKEVFTPSFEIGGLDYGVNYNFFVTPSENWGDGESVSIQLRGKIDPPADVPTIIATELDRDYAVRIEWGAVTDFDLWGYELRVEEISEPYPFPNFVPNWAFGTMLFKGNARNFTWTYKTVGGYCFHIRAVDAFGNYSANSRTVNVDIGVAGAPEGSYSFSGPNVVLSWSIPDSAFAIDHYEISYGSAYDTATAVGTTKGTTFSANVTWGGTRRYWVVAVDVAGNVGTPEFIDVTVTPPGVVSALTPRVIDNNVLLYWTAPTVGSLPVSRYEVSRPVPPDTSYEDSVAIGTVNGTFATVFETESGDYIYWVVAVDSAGNSGDAVSIPATVNQPPDYVLLEAWSDYFSGTPVSALLDDGVLYAPINITETYQEHFVNNSFDSPWEQVVGEYPAWIMPVPTTGTYTRIFNYGSLISALTRITLEVSRDAEKERNSATITPSIEVSTDGETWGTPVEAYTALESGFQYVRVILSFAGSGDDIAAVTRVLVKLDLKQKTLAGRSAVDAAPITVTFSDFGGSFNDITSITVTPESAGTALYAVYDFTDAPNPTHFHIYLFDSSGSAVTNGTNVGWVVRGV